MKTIITIENQTIFDVAVQYYGTSEAVQEILYLNPSIKNDQKGYETDLTEFRFDLPIQANSSLLIDENSRLMNKSLLKGMNETVTTFEIWQEQ